MTNAFCATDGKFAKSGKLITKRPLFVMLNLIEIGEVIER